MNRKHVAIAAAAIILAVLAGACTRSASGGPADLSVMEEELPNPVSTQSELMKEIIASTQTAMAMPLDGEEAEEAEDAEAAEGEEVDAEQPAAEATKAPKEATPIPLPTSTQGPPPVVELEYNTKACPPNFYICVTDIKKDKSIDLQVAHQYLQAKMDLSFKMGPEGNYDFSKYIVAGTAKYEPDGSKGYNFKVTLNIPDALRGTETIVIRLETNNPNIYGSDFFSNQ